MARSPPDKTASDNSRPRFPRGTLLRGAVWIGLSVAALLSSPVQAARSCEDWYAELLGVEGNVEVRVVGTAVWAPAAAHDQLCIGDTVRTDLFSRATIVLRDDTLLRLATDSEFRVGEPQTIVGIVIELFRGILHIISRDPRSLTLTTPHVNAGLEGTEFDLRVVDGEPESAIIVFEGVVRVTSASGEISLPAGQSATVRAGATPVVAALNDPALELGWASHYVPLHDAALPAPDRAPVAAEASDPEFFATRAAARLRSGQVAEAEADLAQAERLGGRNATVLAVRSVIARARGDRAEALAFAEEARLLAPGAVVPLLALSYVLQSRDDLAGAAQSVDRALEIEPNNALALTRRAELAVAAGDLAAGIASASRATTLNATLAGPHTVLGFAYLRRADTAAAITAFERSIALDPSAPEPRLGLAFALIHTGQRAEGRRQLEIAVSVDPSDALTRSYMGKTYDAENRRKLTASQLAFAKDLGPLDPTAWLYDAARLLSENRPIEGLRDVHAATRRNGNRLASRSGLLMDEDLATRSGSAVGHLHREVGFGQLGFLSGWQAVADDPTDYSGHRLLADIYSFEPRHEMARVSELQMAQLLQPLSLTPLQPQLGQPSSFIQNSVGPSELAQTELGPLFTENGLRWHLSTMVGANDTHGEDVALAGVNDKLAYSFGYYDYETDGFRENNDFEQSIANAFVQYRLGSGTSVQAELRFAESAQGDLALGFDPEQFSRELRIDEDTDSLRLGLRHDLTNRDTLLVSSTYQKISSGASSRSAFGETEIDAGGDGYSLDVQEIHRGERWRLQSGLTYAQRDIAGSQRAVASLPFPPFEVESVFPISVDTRQAAAYAYALIDATSTVTVTVGASADSVEEEDFDKHAVSPKLGVTWRPNPRLTVRAAAFETLQASLSTSRQNTQPRLEPVQVAGFNQFLFGANGDAAEVQGVGFDAAVSDRAFAGFDVMERTVERTVVDASDPFGGLIETSGDETQQRAYVYWTPTDRLSLSAQYQHDRFNNDAEGMFGFTDMTIERLPLEVRYFAGSGFNASLRASHVSQDGNFVVRDSLQTDEYAPGEDRFWVVDASLGYRLANRRGVVSLNVENLFDEELRFQDIDAENPSIMPERLLYLRFTLAFD